MKPMLPPLVTPADVASAVEAVFQARGDDEEAHGIEDRLRGELLMAIAERRAERPDECAQVALRTSDFEFERWCG